MIVDELKFNSISIEHIPVVNSWYSDADSFHVEKLTEEFIHYVASNPHYDSFIISNGKELIGKVDFEIEKDKAYIAIIIRPEFRRRGYGKKVIQSILSKYANTGIKQVVAGIFHTNEGSIRLFTSIGFIPMNGYPDEDGFINFVFNYTE
jgi:RimJ/RimL family protein N-acetyltransferase